MIGNAAASLFFATLSSFAGAQGSAARIEGRVTATGTGATVGFATVIVEGTAIATVSDSLGRWVIVGAPAGPRTILVRRIGFASSRTAVVVPTSGTLNVEVTLASNPLQLEQLVVTADRSGRAAGEVATASVIDREAIANQVASSLQGVLELLPGVPLQAPGLDAAAQFSLRALTATSAEAGNIGAAGTLIILDGVPLSNNANLQSVGTRGEVTPTASTAGGGIDLRRIPAVALERVEVIRGVPSARWGDLTQGAIIIDTRAAAIAPEFAGKFDPRTSEANLVGGRAWADDRQAFTATFNVAETSSPRTLSDASTMRGAGQFAHRLRLGEAADVRRGPGAALALARWTFDSRADWWALRYDSPERVDVEAGRSSFQDDQGLRLSERARLSLAGGVLELTAAFDAQKQLTRETRRLARTAVPFTNRLDEGRNIGTYIEGIYQGQYELHGAPRLLYSRLEYQSFASRSVAALDASALRIGVELRREWNAGRGYEFDIATPPQASTITGVNGFDRPRRFDLVPPLVTSAAYADARFTMQRGEMFAEFQPGLRFDILHSGSWWASGAQSTALQPRFSFALAPRSWFRVLGGAGTVSKLPTVSQLFPAKQYYDLVNVNRFTPDPRERLAVVTTFIRDPRNPDLGLARGIKREIGFELDGGRRKGSIAMTFFSDVITGAVTTRRDPLTLMRDRYQLADTAQGSGQPGRIVDPPIGSDPIPIFLSRNVNGGRLASRGVEYTVSFPEIPALRTVLELSGARVSTQFSTSDRDFGNLGVMGNFQLDTTRSRIAYFEGASNRASRGILTWRLIHHQPELGLVITTTVQQRVGYERQTTSARDSVSFEGYLTRTGELVPVPAADRLLPQYADLRQMSSGSPNSASREPDDWMMSLQVAKSIGGGGRLSFYIFNAFDKLATFGGGTVRTLPSSRFGAELTVPTSAFLRGRW